MGHAAWNALAIYADQGIRPSRIEVGGGVGLLTAAGQREEHKNSQQTQSDDSGSVGLKTINGGRLCFHGEMLPHLGRKALIGNSNRNITEINSHGESVGASS